MSEATAQYYRYLVTVFRGKGLSEREVSRQLAALDPGALSVAELSDATFSAHLGHQNGVAASDG